MADLLSRLAAELRSLQAMTAEVEHALGDVITLQGGLDAARLRTLQHLDLVNQSLRALAGVCSDCADGASPDWTLDATLILAKLPLAALARRLAGDAACSGGVDQGDELFTAD